MRALRCSILGSLLVVGVLACGGAPAPSAPPGVATAPVIAPSEPSTAATVEEAEAFFKQVDAEVRRLWVARDRAAWVSLTYITDDTEALAAAGEERTAEFFGRTIKAARRFEGLALSPTAARERALLPFAQLIPAPSDATKRGELAGLQAAMTGAYGKAKFCPPRLAGKCLTLDDLSRVLRTSHNEAELREAWLGWHDLARSMRVKYTRYAELADEGAREIGFKDVGTLWRGAYDMPAEAFEADAMRLWKETKPLYDQLHCYVRSKLRAKYGKDVVPEKAPIPAHLVGNMWAQEWSEVYGLAEPFAGQPSLDVTKKLVQKKTTPTEMVKLGERFFTSLGFDALPETFWQRSQLVRPRDRDVVCHASAWDVTWSNDLRIKMCIEPTEDELITIHHELGHDYYFAAYYQLPTLFQQGANDGFHEGIGDTLALSVTPAYLKSIGLGDSAKEDPKAELNRQLKMAMGKVAFLPFALALDKWRWDVFSGAIPKEKYNAGYWAIRRELQGVAPPVARSEEDFDAGAKYHVPASTPYMRYFLAAIYQFQFHRALCKAAGHTGPLHTCSIYGSKAAGDRLKAMLNLGASKPWPEALAALSGETKADASALLEYFAPLSAFLAEKTKGEQCGW